MSAPGERAAFRILTQNLYLGAEIQFLLSTPSPEEVPERVDTLLERVVATDFPARAHGVARLVRDANPDAICIQEAALWAATEGGGWETVDYLSVLIAALADAGLDYRPAAVSERVEVRLHGRRCGPVRMLIREAVLVAPGWRVERSSSGRFGKQVQAMIGGAAGQAVSFNRGWTAVDLASNGWALRVVTTHLELPGPVQRAQAEEILRRTAASPRPVVLAGDFNMELTVPGGGPEAAGAPRMRDAWRALRGLEPGPTGVQAPDLTNEESRLSERLDGVLVSPELKPVEVSLAGSTPDARVASTRDARLLLWPSDHAAVSAALERA